MWTRANGRDILRNVPSRFCSKAGETYYLEALQEQTTIGDNLSVGWQQPGELAISVIAGRHLTPWEEDRQLHKESQPHGILREYWTNYSAGDLTGLGGARPFVSALSVEEASGDLRGPGKWPKAWPDFAESTMVGGG